MLSQFLNFIDQHQLCEPKSPVLLAVSGGVDSMVMLHLFQQSKWPIRVAHCNFQLRGDEANEDEVFVERYCRSMNIPFYAKKMSPLSYAREKKISIQMASRLLRYRWFDELLQQTPCQQVALAHHINDAIETVLLNLTRGSGILALKGMEAKRGNCIRPLLFATRQKIICYAKRESISWREDRTNAHICYQRNFVRHHIIPLLKKLNPALEENFANHQFKSISESYFFHEGFQNWYRNHVDKQDDIIHIDYEGIAAPRSPDILWPVLKKYSFHPKTVRKIKLSKGHQPSIFTSPTHALYTNEKKWELMPIPTALSTSVTIQTIGEVVLGDYKLVVRKQTTWDLTSPHALLDADKVQFPLTWRKWAPGDYFYPLGMRHRKKLSDFLTDQKVSKPHKQKATVLESCGRIIWVVGHRIDDRYKVESTTQCVLMLELSIR